MKNSNMNVEQKMIHFTVLRLNFIYRSKGTKSRPIHTGKPPFDYH